MMYQLANELDIDTVIIDGIAGEAPLALIATHQIADGVVMLTTLDPRERRVAEAHCSTMQNLSERPWMISCLSMAPGVAPDYLPIEKQWKWLESTTAGLRPKGREFLRLGLPYRIALSLNQSVVIPLEDPFSLRAPYTTLASEITLCLPGARAGGH